MAFDPSIILGYRGVEIPNQLAQYAQMAQVENAQQQNALAQFQLGAARRAEQGQTALGQAYGEFYGGGGSMGAGAPPRAADLTAAYGGGGAVMGGAPRGELPYADMRQAIVNKLRTTAPNLIPAELARINEMEQKALLAKKTQTEIETAGLTQQKTRQDLANTRTAQFRDQLSKVNSPEAAAQWTIGMYNDPYLKDTISSVPLEAALAEIPKTPQEFNVWKNQNALGMTKFIELNKPTTQVINQSGQSQLVQTAGLGGAPTTVGTYEAVPFSPAVAAQKKDIARAGATVLPAQEKGFETKLGTEQADELIKSRNAARDAAAIIDTVKTGRDIMKSGMITGAGADFLVNLNQGLKTAGIDAGYADASANSQAFAANMAANVGKLIKQFGSGTGLSDADRKFAIEMAGGRVSLDSKAIDKILDINEKAARNTITRHNKDVKGVKTNIPLEVEMPPEVKASVVGAPPAAIEYLRANPAMKDAFNAKYGAGAADRALKGQ
jgi:hypothetical protein